MDTQCYITLYNVEMKPELNALVENIDTYLDSRPIKATYDIGYFKHALETSIPLDLSDANILAGQFNYCKIANVGEEEVLYYIMNITWTSEKACTYTLAMDTVNTLARSNNSPCHPSNFTDKTYVYREHKNRVVYPEQTVSLKITQTTEVAAGEEFYNWTTSYYTDNIYTSYELVKITDEDGNIWDEREFAFHTMFYENGQLFFDYLSSDELGDMTFTFHFEGVGDGVYLRNIDRTSEGMNITNLDKINDEIIYDDNGTTDSWYLGYYSEDNTLKTFIVPEHSMTIASMNSGDTITTSTIPSGAIQLNTNGDSVRYGNSTITVGQKYNIVYYIYKEPFSEYNNRPRYMERTIDRIYIYRTGSTLQLAVHFESVPAGYIQLPDNYFIYNYPSYIETSSGLIVNDIPNQLWIIAYNDDYSVITFDSCKLNTVNTTVTRYPNWPSNLSNPQTITITDGGITSYYTIGGIDTTDRTYQKLLKIIKLPYCPIPLTINNGNIIIPVPYTTINNNSINSLPIISPDYSKYGSSLNPSFESIVFKNSKYLYENIFKKEINHPSKHSDIDDTMESKLYHSDFYTYKYNYNINNILIRLERLNIDGINRNTDELMEYKVSNNINSSFGFRINLNIPYLQENDYDLTTVVMDNNEIPIFNSDYLNYIRNGYNYDIKANQLAVKQAQTNSILNVGGGLVSGALTGALTGSSTGPWGAVIGAIIGAGVGVVKSVAHISQLQEIQDLTLEKKLAELKAQSVGVLGNSQVDMTTWYNGNKLHRIIYEPNAEMKDSLLRLFRYYGYRVEKYKKPEVDTRLWYNFIQCEPVLTEEGNRKFHITWINDMKERYKLGVTVFHPVYNTDTSKMEYNLSQSYENWESFIPVTE